MPLYSLTARLLTAAEATAKFTTSLFSSTNSQLDIGLRLGSRLAADNLVGGSFHGGLLLWCVLRRHGVDGVVEVAIGGKRVVTRFH